MLAASVSTSVRSLAQSGGGAVTPAGSVTSGNCVSEFDDVDCAGQALKRSMVSVKVTPGTGAEPVSLMTATYKITSCSHHRNTR